MHAFTHRTHLAKTVNEHSMCGDFTIVFLCFIGVSYCQHSGLGPFNEVVSSDLKLSNPSDKRVCFKVKTTAPKRYCVRPNSGIIEPNGQISVQVMLQPFEYDPNEKNKHKFMVQTMFAPEAKIENQETLWKEATPNQLMDSKLRCVFEMPASGSDSNTSQPAPVLEEKVKPLIKQELKHDFPPPSSGHAAMPSNNSNLGDTDKSESELRKLQSEVERLRQENSNLKESEVRLRKVAMSDTVTNTPTPTTQILDSSSKSSTLPPYLYLIIALIVGVIIGKVIL